MLSAFYAFERQHPGCAAPRSLLDVARARSDLMARGLSPELEDIYSIAAAPRTGHRVGLFACLEAPRHARASGRPELCGGGLAGGGTEEVEK